VKDRPSVEQINDDLETMSMVAVGKKYGVSDNAVRKWIRSAQNNL
jgi:transposase-like protein